MASVHIALGNTCHIDLGRLCADIEQTNKEPLIMGLAKKLKFLCGREYRFEYKVTSFIKALIAHLCGALGCFQYSLGIVPTAKLLLGNVIGIDIQAVCAPLIG